MKRLGISSVLACVAAASLASCGGGGSHGTTLPGPVPTTAAAADYNGPLADATFKITIPVPKTSSQSRRPNYVSSSTTKIVFTLNSDTVGLSGGALTTFNTTNLGAKAVTLNSATCPGSGPWTCTLTIKLPPGTDNVTISAQDGSSNILSQQITNFTVVKATANSFSVILDANAATFTVTASSGFCAGAFTVSNAQTVPTVGTTPLTFNAAYTDPATKPIIGPGLPVLTVNGHTDDNSGAGYSDPGNLNTKVNQSTQSYTLFITTGSGTASVAVTSTHPAGDGLSFSYSLNHSIQAGPAPPSGLLAAIEQTNTTPGSAAGQVDLITMTNPADPTGFGATATLSPTGGPPKDVDNPQDLAFDGNGDLLVANGGAGSPDFGNFACIPAGAITTGANVATIITSHADDPVSLALGTDSSVALANLPAAAPFHLVEYLLSASYAEATSTREISNTDVSGLGALKVVALPTTGANPAGTFAVGMSSGANPPPASSCGDGTTAGDASRVVIKHPDGTTATINDNNQTVVEPLVGYDANAGVLVIAASGACNNLNSISGSTAFLDTWSVGASPAQISSQVINDAGGSPDSSNFTIPGGGAGGGIAVSASGYVAVGGASFYPGSNIQGPEVWVFKPGAGTRTVDDGPIPFNAVTTASGTKTYAYGTPGQMFVTSLRFLGTSNKLLIGFQSNNASFQGFYLYDVANTSVPGPATTGQPCTNTTCYVGASRTAVGKSPTFVAFHATTNHPLAAAYKP